MSPTLIVIVAALLFLCVSMYLGTGWSLVLFTFPIAPKMTVDNYYLQFVPQVDAATRFFTYMTMLMLALCGVLIWAEWHTVYLWVPIAVLVLVIVATVLTKRVIFPLNLAMKDGIRDPAVLKTTLAKWMTLNRVRVGLWTVQWLSMMWYFTAKALD